MVELHSPPGRYTLIIWYLAEYVNTLILLWFILEYNTNPFWFSHIYTWKVLLPHFIHYHHDPTLSSLCNKTFTWLRFITYHAWIRLSFCIWTHWNHRTDWLIRDALPRGASRAPRTYLTRSLWQPEHATSKVAPKCILILTIKESRGKLVYTMECHTCTITFIYGIQSVHEIEFVFSFNRIHCNYCHSANDRVFVLGWGIGWCCRPGLDGRGLQRMLQYAQGRIHLCSLLNGFIVIIVIVLMIGSSCWGGG